MLPDVKWCHEVTEWYNEFVTCEYSHKRKQCYLIRRTNIRKSTFVNFLLRDVYPRVNVAGRGQYCIDDFNSNFHKTVIFDEFDLKNFDESYLKVIWEGGYFKITQKLWKIASMLLRVPIFIISNYTPAVLQIRKTIIHGTNAIAD